MNFVYRIRVRSELEPFRKREFGEMSLNHLDSGETELIGPVENQEVLHLLLQKFRDLNIELISIERLEDQAEQRRDMHDDPQ